MTSADTPGVPDASSAVVRASDAEREQVVSRLHTAVSEGRLTLSEFSDRTETVYAARTRGDLEKLLSDLPEPGAATSSTLEYLGSTPPSSSQQLGVGAVKRRGRWRMPASSSIAVKVGTVKLDLCDVEITTPQVELECSVRLGSIKVWVPEGIRVIVDGQTELGSRMVEENHLPDNVPAPTVRMRLDTGFGTVKVMRVQEHKRRRRYF
ncbi:MAG TPA: DUF1707 domain-containing protein [Stackebrandtia sp.]|jgi:hypothetical protein|uniref:DUF1707 SHOCT-like domain-containing protein n=1 Tax=Stackebrandtia sp. TaxID=2023065 RepID=UPI002D26A3ED|nr:DUF1707 domain-containing protein [Stackebrandtia sp.]HZE38208.1 DUF1707 domain-containing protein [Stackebrandtia sp.]